MSILILTIIPMMEKNIPMNTIISMLMNTIMNTVIPRKPKFMNTIMEKSTDHTITSMHSTMKSITTTRTRGGLAGTGDQARRLSSVLGKISDSQTAALPTIDKICAALQRQIHKN